MTRLFFLCLAFLVANYAIISSIGVASAAPTGNEGYQLSDMDSRLLQSTKRMRAHFKSIDKSLLVKVDGQKYEPWVYQQWAFWPAFDFAANADTCSEVQVEAVALAFTALGSMQYDVAREIGRVQPNWRTEAMDWFFMVDNPFNPNSWSMNPKLKPAWEAIKSNTFSCPEFTPILKRC